MISLKKINQCRLIPPIPAGDLQKKKEIQYHYKKKKKKKLKKNKQFFKNERQLFFRII
jgi:hypothetical protein